MQRGRGLQAEVLASLALVMLTAAVVVVGLVVQAHRTQIATLERLAARTLQADAGRPHPLTAAAVPELRWWRVAPGGGVQPIGGHGDVLDADSLTLARAAGDAGRALVKTALPWEATRFAAPLAGEVRVARLPPAVRGGWLLGLVAVEVCVFTGFGLVLLRRRLVEPLERLASAARSIAEGDYSARVRAEGPRETAAVASAFNAMTEALALRTEALEKAVADLRRSNHDLQEARAGLDRAERLAAVGQLAAGVAHEVGNPMGAVLAFLDVAGRDPGLSAKGRDHIQRALQAGGRVRTILRQLLDFSRPPRPEPTAIDLEEIARETAGLLRAQRRYAEHEIRVEVLGETPAALGDRGQVAQILLNLLINAGDACAEADAPRVDVRVSLGSPGPRVPGSVRGSPNTSCTDSFRPLS